MDFMAHELVVWRRPGALRLGQNPWSKSRQFARKVLRWMEFPSRAGSARRNPGIRWQACLVAKIHLDGIHPCPVARVCLVRPKAATDRGTPARLDRVDPRVGFWLPSDCSLRLCTLIRLPSFPQRQPNL